MVVSEVGITAEIDSNSDIIFEYVVDKTVTNGDLVKVRNLFVDKFKELQKLYSKCSEIQMAMEHDLNGLSCISLGYNTRITKCIKEEEPFRANIDKLKNEIKIFRENSWIKSNLAERNFKIKIKNATQSDPLLYGGDIE
ncbi:MAG: hypothetical protein LBT69_04335 [Lactobacillales bacterium]|jgi:hypothetical protein|nr:hypothetical protein [Lactobacillales bacterium]